LTTGGEKILGWEENNIYLFEMMNSNAISVER